MHDGAVLVYARHGITLERINKMTAKITVGKPIHMKDDKNYKKVILQCLHCKQKMLYLTPCIYYSYSPLYNTYMGYKGKLYLANFLIITFLCVKKGRSIIFIS